MTAHALKRALIVGFVVGGMLLGAVSGFASSQKGEGSAKIPDAQDRMEGRMIKEQQRPENMMPKDENIPPYDKSKDTQQMMQGKDMMQTPGTKAPPAPKQ